MGENKVRFGLKNVHYAKLTESSGSSNNTFATPVAVPGAVSMTIDSSVANNTFYADNIAYFKWLSNNGYTGTLEMARISDAMLKDIWGMTSSGGILYEEADVQPSPFALLFQIDGDADNELNVFYRVVPTSKPTGGSQTIGENKEPVTQSFTFEVLPLVTGPAYQKGKIKGRTDTTSTTEIRSAWFSAVQIATTA